MKLEIHDKLGNPQIIECTRILIRDSVRGVNNPVMVVIEHAPGQFWTCDIQDGTEQFARALKLMGVDETVICETVDASTLARPPGELILPPGT